MSSVNENDKEARKAAARDATRRYRARQKAKMEGKPEEPGATLRNVKFLSPLKDPAERRRAYHREFAREWFSDPAKREERNARLQERYATEPEYREKMKVRARETPVERRREIVRASYAKRVASDPSYKEARNEKKRLRRREMAGQINAKNRERYANDPEYRAQLADYAKQAKARRTPAQEEHQREWMRVYVRVRGRKDVQFHLANVLRARFLGALKAHLHGRRVSPVRDLGCSLPEFVAYIEARFEPWMTWENFGRGAGRWTLDHVRPLSSFDLSGPEQQRAACHYTNMQPLEFTANLRKHSKWIPPE